jgi:hypothetical protein
MCLHRAAAVDSVEAKLHQDLRYKLAAIDGMSEILLQALDKEDMPAIDPADLDPVESSKFHAVVLEFVRESIFVLAREIDQLRTDPRDPS